MVFETLKVSREGGVLFADDRVQSPIGSGAEALHRSHSRIA
jgi:hypothetical protein